MSKFSVESFTWNFNRVCQNEGMCSTAASSVNHCCEVTPNKSKRYLSSTSVFFRRSPGAQTLFLMQRVGGWLSPIHTQKQMDSNANKCILTSLTKMLSYRHNCNCRGFFYLNLTTAQHLLPWGENQKSVCKTKWPQGFHLSGVTGREVNKTSINLGNTSQPAFEAHIQFCIGSIRVTNGY